MAETQTVSPTPETSAPATPAPTPAPAPAAAPGTAEPQKGSEAPATSAPAAQGEAAPSEDSFLSNDPKSLPPELRKHYDNMLRDYKRKTADVAELRKRAEAFDAIRQDKRFVDFWTNQVALEQQALRKLEDTKQGMDVSDEEFEKALSSKQEFLKLMAKVAQGSTQDIQKKLEQTQAELTTSRASEAIEEFAEQGHQDIYDLESNYGFISYQFKADPNIKLDDAYNNAKAVYDQIYQKGFEAARAELQANMQKKAAASTEIPSGAPAGAYAGPDPKKLTAAEALAYARKGIVVPQR